MAPHSPACGLDFNAGLQVGEWGAASDSDCLALKSFGYQREPNEFDLIALAKATDGLTGSEIEQAFVESLYMAFDEENAATDPREPTDLTIATVLIGLVPLSKLMAEQIASLRNWASGRARYATTVHEDRRIRKLG